MYFKPLKNTISVKLVYFMFCKNLACWQGEQCQETTKSFKKNSLSSLTTTMNKTGNVHLYYSIKYQKGKTLTKPWTFLTYFCSARSLQSPKFVGILNKIKPSFTVIQGHNNCSKGNDSFKLQLFFFVWLVFFFLFK